ncbi:hypothetical protein Hanom_Chr10g00940761 [Helianthus anomalus]
MFFLQVGGGGGVATMWWSKAEHTISVTMLKSPAILLLDGETSALYSESEKLVQEAME